MRPFHGFGAGDNRLSEMATFLRHHLIFELNGIGACLLALA
jgi:hypothetical protein